MPTRISALIEPMKMLKRTGLVAAAVLLVGGCSDLTLPDYNNPDLEEVEQNPTASAIRNLSTGLLVGARQDVATDRTSYVPMLGIIGRESYTLDGSDPRFISELLVGPLSNSGAFGGGLWSQRYQNLRNANILLNAVEKISDDPIAGVTPQQKEAIRGYAKTIQALDYLLLINARGANGAVIDVNRPVSADPAPLATRAEVFAHIVKLLDEARTHLGNGGDAFPFQLSDGFDDFDTPETFLEFNRALRARVDVYQQSYAQALTSLDGSFLNASEPLGFGAYHSYAAGSGETPNSLTSPTIRAHPSVAADAELQPGGELDKRVLTKLVRDEEPRCLSELCSAWRFTMYTSPDADVPVIRNEELILLRAEARWFTGNRAGAIEDLNLIRVRSGGLAPLATVPTTDEAFVTELLEQRRYSLLYEGGHRWLDMRRFGRLDELPKDKANFTVHDAFGIPEGECLARNLGSTCSAGG